MLWDPVFMRDDLQCHTKEYQEFEVKRYASTWVMEA